MDTTNHIRLGITMGDPAGIGPEVILKAFTRADTIPPDTSLLVIGSADVLSQYAEVLENSATIETVNEAALSSIPSTPGTIYVLDPETKYDIKIKLIMGKETAVTGRASFDYVATAVRLALLEKIDGVVTAPISKSAWHMADITFPGHTEMLAHYSNTTDFAMMMVAGGLRVVLATIHSALKDVAPALYPQKLISLFQLVNSFMPCCGITGAPRIGVCGLNPHAGEGGLMGDEEGDIIIPAIREAQQNNINVLGPFPADTIFHNMLNGEFDVIIAMYHDQALIPIKTLDFYGGVNVTIGLPFIRTSVDHGTAFGIAGKGLARPDSLIQAIRLAAEYTRNKRIT